MVCVYVYVFGNVQWICFFYIQYILLLLVELLLQVIRFFNFILCHFRENNTIKLNQFNRTIELKPFRKHRVFQSYRTENERKKNAAYISIYLSIPMTFVQQVKIIVKIRRNTLKKKNRQKRSKNKIIRAIETNHSNEIIQ